MNSSLKKIAYGNLEEDKKEKFKKIDTADNIKKKIASGKTFIDKEICLLEEPDDLSRAVTQFGKDIYKQKEVNKRRYKNGRPRDLISCDICGVVYTRYNKFNHCKTTKHQIYANMNQALKKALLGI